METEKVLTDILTDVLKERKRVLTFTPAASTTFKELDLDSLDQVEIMMRIEDTLGISFGDDFKASTVGEVLNKILELHA